MNRRTMGRMEVEYTELDRTQQELQKDLESGDGIYSCLANDRI